MAVQTLKKIRHREDTGRDFYIHELLAATVFNIILPTVHTSSAAN